MRRERVSLAEVISGAVETAQPMIDASDLATPGKRAAHLGRECGDNLEHRARVEALLAAQDLTGSAPMAPRPGPGEIATLYDTAAETLARSITPAGSEHGATVATANAEPGVTIPGNITGSAGNGVPGG